jgi:hypothetical protein
MSLPPLDFVADDAETAVFLAELPRYQLDALNLVISVTDQHAKEAIKLLRQCE